MIRSITSSLPSFKKLRFHEGLNVLLAEKTKGANDRQTRNGVGKTSFVELVHFLMGGNCGPDHFLQSPALSSHGYAIDFDLADLPVTVERVPEQKKRLAILDGDVSSWPEKPKLNKKSGHLSLSNAHWCTVLGTKMFGLPAEDADDTDRFGPSFRSLFSYFARRQRSGGLVTPAKQAEEQLPYDQQVALSYLLGLDASIPQSLQSVRQREKALGEVRKAAKDGAFGDLVPKAADLRTKLTVQEARLNKLREQLVSFRVVPEYSALEREASEITTRLSALVNDNHMDRDLVRRLEDAMQAEAPPQYADVRRAYEEAGVSLPGLVQKRFEEVQRFHLSIIENRRSHLRSELQAAQRRIEERDHEKVGLDHRRAEIMGILQSGGALEHFMHLQGELARLESDTESLRRRFEAAETFERKDAQLGVERARIHQRLKDDHREQKLAIDDAILSFEELSSDLYEKAGSLTVSDAPNGPTFEVRIEGSRSLGITNMQIFCFDMMLMELCLRRGMGPRFLIHDSHLFDGVDERQVARALELGAKRARGLGFQYIVTMNEDAVPRGAFTSSFKFDEHVLPTRLMDAHDDGGLFGLRFE